MTHSAVQSRVYPSRMRRQSGGTFLGLVIGLVLGLGIALGVAVYVTKVPVPFLNKGQSRSGEQDAAEAQKNKDWDPNAMIQGKNPVRAASGAVSTGDAPAPAAAEVPAAAPPKVATKPEPKADAKAESKTQAKIDAKPEPKASAPAPAGDPLGDLAKAKAASPGLDGFTYMVQTGAFRTPEEADAQRAKLALQGVDAKVSEREQAGRTVYRVRSGPFERRQEADQMKDKLDGLGFETVLVRIQR